VKRRLLLCTTIVAAIQALPAGATAVSEDVPVPGGTIALARALGVDPAPDRGRFVSEITRLLTGSPEGHRGQADAFLEAARQRLVAGHLAGAAPAARPADLVPVPLTADLWSRAIFHRTVAPTDLVMTILTDRSAALLCYGLAALDDRTLAFVADNPALLTRLYERSAPTFAAFSGGLHVDGGRVRPTGPGRAETGSGEVDALWESVLLEKVTAPDRFIPLLFEASDGRLAYLYDTVNQLDPPRRAFVLGLWMPDPAERAARFKELVTFGITAFREWHVDEFPFTRSPFDLGATLARVVVTETGSPAEPAARGLWRRVFGGTSVTDDPELELLALEEQPIDAAFLAEVIGPGDLRQRGDRLDQLAFGPRVFGAADRADVFLALRGISRYHMLIVTLERIGIRAPKVYSAALAHAARLSSIDGRRGFDAQAQLQGALALVARMARVRTLDVAHAQTLVERLAAVPVTEEGRYAGGIALWVSRDLAGAIRSSDDVESAVIAAMSGPASGEPASARTVSVWEGQPYRLDLGAAERRRLSAVREKQNSPRLDLALDIAAIARTLSGERFRLDDLPALTNELSRLALNAPHRSRQDEEDNTPARVPPSGSAQDALRRIGSELTKAAKSRDLKRFSRSASALVDLADGVLGQTLLSLTYAGDVGDPDGSIMLATDVSRRHDFGFAANETEQRQRMAWALPRAVVMPGVPWHMTGSLVGLDVGLAPLALRRLNTDRVIDAPRLSASERETFATSVSLMNPFDLRNADRDAIVDAIARGRVRVLALADRRNRTAGFEARFDELADAIDMEGHRRRSVRWTIEHEPGLVLSLFSLTELFSLGGGRPADADAWGMSMMTVDGCACTRLTAPGRWTALAGRPRLGLTAVGVADLNLRVAEVLKEIGLPAALARVVLSGAMQDFIDEVKPTDDADWLTLARSARSVSRDRIEDYVAVATAVGPLVPEVSEESSRP
jgi:hypothetical protein